MRGCIIRRGERSWRLKFEAGERDPITGKRQTRYVTVRGTKKDAQAKLTELLAAVNKGSFVEPSKITVAEYVRSRVEQWAASGEIGGKTAERYRELVENQIVPHIGNKLVQRLRPMDIGAWHTTLRTSGRRDGKGGISARTIGHAHRVLSKALSEAVKNDIAHRNVAALETAPSADTEEIQILNADRVHDLCAKLRDHELYPHTIVALTTGLRRGELLALRWGNVDIDGAKVIRVREAIEETKAGGLRFKPPKTKAGRRDITLPDLAVEALREHRRKLLERRLVLGLGRLRDEDFVFPAVDGSPPAPRRFTKAWAAAAAGAGHPEVTFHALRHTHASQLISAGLDVVTVSRRLGHAKPTITLGIYAHLFEKDDSKAAAAINAALASLGAR